MVQKNIQTSAPKKKNGAKETGERWFLFKGKTSPKLVALKWRFFAQSILACLVLHVWFLNNSWLHHRKRCVGFFVFFGWMFVGWSFRENSTKSPQMRSGMKWFGMWMFCGWRKPCLSIRLDCCGFSKTTAVDPFRGVLKLSYAIVFNKVHSRMVSIAIVILTVLSPYSIKPTQLFPRTHPTNFKPAPGSKQPPPQYHT